MATRKPGKKTGRLEPAILPRSLTKGARTSTPSTDVDVGVTITDKTTSYFNRSLSGVRTGAVTDKEAIRLLARLHGDVSASVSAYVRLANTPLKFSVFDSRHQISEAGSALLRTVIARMDFLSDYTRGYDDRQSVSGLCESLLREVPLTGACAAELVLDEARLPFKISVVPTRQLKMVAGKAEGTHKKIIPSQSINGEDTPLDFATFFYASMDQDPENAFATSQLEPALTASLFHSEVVDDIRRVVRQSGHSRLTGKLATEAVIKAAPADVRSSPELLKKWMDSVRDAVTEEVERLTPESALIYFDMVDFDYLNSEIGDRANYTPLIETIDGIQATALKTPPSVIGKRMGGSQNVSSTESLLFLKTAAGIQPPVATVLSRALTLAVRLFGFDGYVKVGFKPLNLRPDIEVEAFEMMKQDRVLELLSLGFLTDDEAAIELGTGPRAPGAPPLSGTMFHSKKGLEPPAPNDDPARTALTPETPSKSGGESQ